MRGLLDTNVLIYAYFIDTKKHGIARRILNSLDEWLVPYIVLVELVWFGRGAGLDDKRIRDMTLTFLSDNRFRLIHNELEEIVDSLAVENPLDWEDELIILIAERMGVPLVTFDENMREKAKRRSIQLIP